MPEQGVPGEADQSPGALSVPAEEHQDKGEATHQGNPKDRRTLVLTLCKGACRVMFVRFLCPFQPLNVPTLTRVPNSKDEPSLII